MTIKHKVLKDFQLITDDKKILILKAKTVIEDYKFKNKSETVSVPVDIIKNNPDYFSFIDWKEELQSYLKVNKIPQPAVITKKLVPFIETMMKDTDSIAKEIIVEKEVIKEVIIEKPKVVEKIVSDDSLSIELETKLKKIQLKESQLDKEIEEANTKELDATTREKKAHELEKTYTEKLKEIELESKRLEEIQYLLEEREKVLNERDILITTKEKSLSEYIKSSDVIEKMNIIKSEGYSPEFLDQILKRIL